MSPNEAQLRAALRAGEGESLDPDAILARARTTRSQRRRTRTAIGATAAMVAAVAGSVTAIAAANHGGQPAAGPSASVSPSRPGIATRPAPAIGGPSTEPGPDGTPYVPAGCTATAPELKWPKDPTGTAAAGPVFPAGVESITLCAYQLGQPSQSHPFQSARTITGSTATALADRINQLPPVTGVLPSCPPDSGPWYSLIVTTSGDAAPVVVASTSGCGVITNGTAIRFWSGNVINPLLKSLPPVAPVTPGRKSHGPAPS